MENTALLLAQRWLPDGYVTVGRPVDVRHIHPARNGGKLIVKTALPQVNAEKHLIFSVDAYRNNTKIELFS